MRHRKLFFSVAYLLGYLFLSMSCATTQLEPLPEEELTTEKKVSLNYLALGDSYTIGESVSVSESFPRQLTSQLNSQLDEQIKTDIIATTGWRTDDLIDAINLRNPLSKYDFVTLLIGVNNQYQNRPFSQYETEFETLLNKAISLAKGDEKSVFVISIPDYAYTPFSRNLDGEAISLEIDRYNTWANEAAVAKGVGFINITDITRLGLEDPELVADDGLHPSGEAYRRFVLRILPFAESKLRKE